MSLVTLNHTGDKFLDEIFNDLITVYEDVQGSKLLVRWTGDDFEFRAKTINNDPISFVDLSLQRYYNKAINFFYSLEDRVLDLLPKNWHFCFEYFPDEQPAHISYNKVPQNNLILTGIIKGKRFQYNIEEILEFSNLLYVDPLPVIFHGKLNQKQKENIKAFLYTSEEDLEYIFGERNFAFFFYYLLDPTHKHSFLMEDGNYQDNIEKLIIRTSNNQESFVILNPLYKRISSEYETDFAEIYSLIILNFLSYCQLIDLDKLKLSGTKKDEVYVDLMCRLYNMYLNDTSDDLENFYFEIPKFFDKEKFKINVELIQNNLTKKYLKQNSKFEYIFKCILGSFRKKKTKEIGVFTKNSVLLFNKFIDNIEITLNKYLNKIKEDQLRNTKMMNFDKFYDFKYDVDGADQVYPDVYTEFETSDDKSKLKKDKGFGKDKFGL